MMANYVDYCRSSMEGWINGYIDGKGLEGQQSRWLVVEVISPKIPSFLEDPVCQMPRSRLTHSEVNFSQKVTVCWEEGYPRKKCRSRVRTEVLEVLVCKGCWREGRRH
jgi:hypothetical protein